MLDAIEILRRANLSKPQLCYLGEGGGGGRNPHGDIRFCSDTQLWYPIFYFWSNNKLRYQSLSSETQLRLTQNGHLWKEGEEIATTTSILCFHRKPNFGIKICSSKTKNDIKIFLSDFSNCRVKNTPLVRNMDAFSSCIWGLTYVAHVFKAHYDKLHYALN